jgi:hypothetical protein
MDCIGCELLKHQVQAQGGRHLWSAVVDDSEVRLKQLTM